MRLMLAMGAHPRRIKSAPIVREVRKHDEIEHLYKKPRQGRRPEEDQNIRRLWMALSPDAHAGNRGRNVEEKVTYP